MQTALRDALALTAVCLALYAVFDLVFPERDEADRRES